MGSNKYITKLRLKYRPLFFWVILELITVIVFILLFISSRPINVEETHTADIYVTRIDLIHAFGYPCAVYSGDEKYYFPNLGVSAHYSNSELSEMIGVGDRISIVYENRWGIPRTTRWIVDARSHTEVFRSVEEYSKSKKGLPLILCIVFCLIEGFYVGLFILAYLVDDKLRGLLKRRKK